MKKVEIKITDKGAAVKSNPWKKDQKVKVHPGIAEQLIEKGFASGEVNKESKENKK